MNSGLSPFHFSLFPDLKGKKKGVVSNHARTTTRRMEEPCGDQPVGWTPKPLPVCPVMQHPDQ
jgi:hypothetical protein